MSLSPEVPRVCAKCGRAIPPGQAQCVCAARPHYWLHSRETILLLCIAGLGVAFVVTGVAAKTYHAQRRTLAMQWHAQGVSDLAAGRADKALVDFRTAMLYGRENVSSDQLQAYQLDLAESLVAAGHRDEARSYLIDLWQQVPGNGKINLDLARLSVRDGDDNAARRYYEAAINGLWTGTPDQVAQDRYDTRLELYRYLLARGDSSAAQSELLAAAASLPPDSSAVSQLGELMLQNGRPDQALMQFEKALRNDRRDQEALIGAGLASFDLGDDATAARYLEQALREKPPKSSSSMDAEQQQASKTLAIARATIAIDPQRTGLSAEDRAQRVLRARDAAIARLQGCAEAHNIPLPKTLPATSSAAPPANDLTGLYVQLAEARQSQHKNTLLKDPQKVEQTMNLVFAAEQAAAQECGTPDDPTDAALVRIAARAQGGHS